MAANRPVDVHPARRAALDAGTVASATLAEALVVDFAALLGTLPGIEARGVAAMRAAADEGVVARMKRGGAILADAGLAPIDHPSDTVRGWAAFAAMADASLTLDRCLAAIRPFADDAHFGVREWAWMAIRPALAAELPAALARLMPFAESPRENLRRFASEATRPRGVWCAHIPGLRRDPSPALPLLDALRADPARYVQLSVGNWINDAGKDNAAWVNALAGRWGRTDPNTARILARGLRNLR
ncbi:DNA alkylation repair protein [Elioraea sp.]|uniref:DNA alkylation repair protein n=1 Tax=Elioraea sp. TaxID=2185103 RepID=UPI0025C13626|nr:DNA alkylation repair protein [Elioraea sp.]